MGYSTEFFGHVTVEPPLNEHEISYLEDFSRSRRMHRSFGPYFADPGSDSGQYTNRQAPDVVYNHNSPDPSQPGLWCHWEANEPGTQIHWDGGEKFYYAEEWMEYIVNHFFKPGAVVQKLLLDGATTRKVIDYSDRSRPSDADLAWIAGFFDGEGYVGRTSPDKRGHSKAQVSVCQKSSKADVLDIFAEFFGGSVYEAPQGPLGNEPMKRWQTAKQEDVAFFLDVIIPHLRVKQPEAMKVRESIGTPRGRGNQSPSALDARFAHFTFDHVVNGEILAEGEDQGDVWKIVVVNNELDVKKARIVWED